MWTTIYMAMGKDTANEIQRKLEQEGFIVKTRFYAIEGEDELYEILAPEFEAEDILEVLFDLGII